MLAMNNTKIKTNTLKTMCHARISKDTITMSCNKKSVFIINIHLIIDSL